jgi:hypothetical protein
MARGGFTTEGTEGTKIFWRLAARREPRKDTEIHGMGKGELARVGFNTKTRRDEGLARGVGHGRTRKSTEWERGNWRASDSTRRREGTKVVEGNDY